MPAPEVCAEISGDGTVDLVEVGAYPSFAVGSEHGLVVLAMGHAYWLVPAGHGFSLMVERQLASGVREQLTKFVRESIGWPPAPISIGSAHPADLFTPLLWALTVVAAFWLAAWFPDAVAFGALDSEALFRRGEAWRVFTALFLHADVAHLASNLVAGVFTFSAVLSAFGRGRGWWLLLVSALLGNLASAGIHQPARYISIGASTAIFAGLGLLTARAIALARHSAHPHIWRGMLVPFGAGLSVLALYGAGDARVDLGAHATGFVAGCLVAIVDHVVARRRTVGL